jgi:D-mannonate dehydratase
LPQLIQASVYQRTRKSLANEVPRIIQEHQSTCFDAHLRNISNQEMNVILDHAYLVYCEAALEGNF